MIPANPPEHIKAQYADLDLISVGAPDGMPEEECGTMPALVGRIRGGIFDGGPVFRTFWELEPGELEMLNNGGTIQLFMYASQIPPQGMMVMEGENNG